MKIHLDCNNLVTKLKKKQLQAYLINVKTKKISIFNYT